MAKCIRWNSPRRRANRELEVIDGVQCAAPIKVIGEPISAGTEVHFWADEEIFTHVEFHYEILVQAYS